MMIELGGSEARMKQGSRIPLCHTEIALGWYRRIRKGIAYMPSFAKFSSVVRRTHAKWCGRSLPSPSASFTSSLYLSGSSSVSFFVFLHLPVTVSFLFFLSLYRFFSLSGSLSVSLSLCLSVSLSLCDWLIIALTTWHSNLVPLLELWSSNPCRFEFSIFGVLLESNRRPRDRPSCALTNWASYASSWICLYFSQVSSSLPLFSFFCLSVSPSRSVSILLCLCLLHICMCALALFLSLSRSSPFAVSLFVFFALSIPRSLSCLLSLSSLSRTHCLPIHSVFFARALPHLLSRSGHFEFSSDFAPCLLSHKNAGIKLLAVTEGIAGRNRKKDGKRATHSIDSPLQGAANAKRGAKYEAQGHYYRRRACHEGIAVAEMVCTCSRVLCQVAEDQTIRGIGCFNRFFFIGIFITWFLHHDDAENRRDLNIIKRTC